jgi:hypothetical protein
MQLQLDPNINIRNVYTDGKKNTTTYETLRVLYGMDCGMELILPWALT